ncbi:MAG: hypothetical protein IJE51_05420 [Clostridia bacterium]|nr:hypothetical protein [Clostridia bacterium]
MKLNKVLISLALVATALTTACGNQSSIEPPRLDTGSTGAEISARIAEIGDVSLEKELLIEEIYVDYMEMTDLQKEKVENIDVLNDAREQIAKLYNTEEKDGPRIDRSKILTGVYCFYTTNEQGVQWAKEAGIDIIIGASYNTEFLDLLHKYEMGAFISYLPSWWGDGGQRGGQLATNIPSGAYNAYAESFVDHPAIWAMDVGDEPSALDFPHYGILIDEAKELFPNQLIFLNLYPNYANQQQQGTPTYEEHIQIYSDNVNTDYISWDFYNISIRSYRLNKNSTHGRNMINRQLLCHVENLRIVADICRETDRDVWTVIQSGGNSDKNNDSQVTHYINEDQALLQIYTGLTFGTKAFYWACWQDGWNDPNTNMINSAGERTESYYSVKAANAKLEELSPVYMKYTNTDTAFFGDTDQITNLPDYVIADSDADVYDFIANDGNVLDQDTFKDITVTRDDAIILAGSFVKNTGDGTAMMFANVSDFVAYKTNDSFYTHKYETKIQFKITVPNAKVYIYHTDYTTELIPNDDGVYTFELNNTQGAFVTVHSEPEITVE